MYLDYIYKSKRLTGLLIQVNFFSMFHLSSIQALPFISPSNLLLSLLNLDLYKNLGA